MNITPGIKIACMGGLGYLFGMVAKTNPKMTAIVWLIAETAVQIFQQTNAFEKHRLEIMVRIVLGSIACIYLIDQHLITKTIQGVLSLATFCLIPEIMNLLNIRRIEIAHY